eukprot:18393-Heterococcus_DN1.PRE.1
MPDVASTKTSTVTEQVCAQYKRAQEHSKACSAIVTEKRSSEVMPHQWSCQDGSEIRQTQYKSICHEHGDLLLCYSIVLAVHAVVAQISLAVRAAHRSRHWCMRQASKQQSKMHSSTGVRQSNTVLSSQVCMYSDSTQQITVLLSKQKPPLHTLPYSITTTSA